MRQSNPCSSENYADLKVKMQRNGWGAAVECNYKEIDCQLKEQFIHGLNDKTMLDKVIRESCMALSNLHLPQCI